VDAREAACSCGQLRLTAEGDPVRISMCPLPGLPAPDRQCVLAAGSVGGRPGPRGRPLLRLRSHRGRRQGEDLPLLPRLRRHGLLHGRGWAGRRRGSDRRVCRSLLSAAHRFGLGVAAARVDFRARWRGTPGGDEEDCRARLRETGVGRRYAARRRSFRVNSSSRR
jgi:hypothetical protein